MKPLVYTHNSVEGMAALGLWASIRGPVEYRVIKYGSPIHPEDIAGRDVVFLCYTPKLEARHAPASVHTLEFQDLQEHLQVPDNALLTTIQDVSSEAYRLENSRAVYAALDSEPRYMDWWVPLVNAFAQEIPPGYIEKGRLLNTCRKELVVRAIEGLGLVESSEHGVLYGLGNVQEDLASDVTRKFLDDMSQYTTDHVIVYADDVFTGVRRYFARSRPDGIVTALSLAEKYGGRGTTHKASWEQWNEP